MVTIFHADHVIVTSSIGFLKAKQAEFFEPSLPERHRKAINTTGFGNVAKLFLIWEGEEDRSLLHKVAPCLCGGRWERVVLGSGVDGVIPLWLDGAHPLLQSPTYTLPMSVSIEAAVGRSQQSLRVRSENILYFTSLHLSHSLFDRWGTKDDRATTVSPFFSVFGLSKGFHPTLILSTPLCCLPILFFCLASPSPSLYSAPVGSSLQVLLILFCAHTISVFVSSQW